MRRAAFAGLWAVGLLARALELRHSDSFDGDGAVYLLMAKHIAELKEFPLYMWLNHYGGTLSEYLAAACFRGFGVSLWAGRLPGLVWSCALAALCYELARRLFGSRAAAVALALALIPPYPALPWMLFYQYGDMAVFACLALLLLAVPAPDGRERGRLAAVGLVSGVGAWLSPGFSPFLLAEPVILRLRGERTGRRELLAWLSGFLPGYAPAIVYNVRHPGAQALRLGGRLLGIGRADVAAGHLPALLARRVLWRLSLAPRALLHIPISLAALTSWADVALFAAAAAWLWTRRKEPRLRAGAVIVGACSLCCVFFQAFLVAEDAPRFVFVFYPLFALSAAAFLSEGVPPAAGAATAALVLLLHGWSLAAAFARPPVHHYEDLAARLRAEGRTRAYADYWIAYPVTFYSGERVLVSPTLLDPTFADRYPPYTKSVRDAEGAVMIVDRERQPAAAAVVDAKLAALGVGYRKERVDEFDVYSRFTRRLYPEELAPLPR